MWTQLNINRPGREISFFCGKVASYSVVFFLADDLKQINAMVDLPLLLMDSSFRSLARWCTGTRTPLTALQAPIPHLQDANSWLLVRSMTDAANYLDIAGSLITVSPNKRQ